jgi:hypothetical protein
MVLLKKTFMFCPKKLCCVNTKYHSYVTFKKKFASFIIGQEPEPHHNSYPEPDPHKNDEAPQYWDKALLTISYFFQVPVYFCLVTGFNSIAGGALITILYLHSTVSDISATAWVPTPLWAEHC